VGMMRGAGSQPLAPRLPSFRRSALEFAPKTAKPQTKTGRRSTSELAPHHAELEECRLGNNPVEDAQFLQRAIGNQAALPLFWSGDFEPNPECYLAGRAKSCSCEGVRDQQGDALQVCRSLFVAMLVALTSCLKEQSRCRPGGPRRPPLRRPLDQTAFRSYGFVNVQLRIC